MGVCSMQRIARHDMRALGWVLRHAGLGHACVYRGKCIQSAGIRISNRTAFHNLPLPSHHYSDQPLTNTPLPNRPPLPPTAARLRPLRPVRQPAALPSSAALPLPLQAPLPPFPLHPSRHWHGARLAGDQRMQRGGFCKSGGSRRLRVVCFRAWHSAKRQTTAWGTFSQLVLMQVCCGGGNQPAEQTHCAHVFGESPNCGIEKTLIPWQVPLDSVPCVFCVQGLELPPAVTVWEAIGDLPALLPREAGGELQCGQATGANYLQPLSAG